MNKAVFIDKDGTLIHDVPYNADPARVTFTFGARESLRRLNEAGWRVFMVTNQPGVAAGLITEEQLTRLKRHLRRECAAEGARIDAIYACVHGRPPQGEPPGCACRKPRPGMILRAAEEFGIDLAASWMVGDILDDVEAGNRAGCRSILYCNGNETEWDLAPERLPHRLAFSLPQAASMILGHE